MEVNDTVPPGVLEDPVPVTVAVRVTEEPMDVVPGEVMTTVDVAVPAISWVTELPPGAEP